VLWRGQYTWVGLSGSYVSGGAVRVTSVCIAPIADNFRNLTDPPATVMVATLPWETNDWKSLHCFVDEGKLWIVYRTGNGDSVPFSFGAAYAEAVA
jgi:hypothetical protein